MATSVFISEFHYDNTGTDVGEFVEIAGPAGTDLTGWSLVLYNGNGGTVYGTVALSGVIADQSNGQGTVVVDFPSNGIQNGAPDGLALVDGLGNVVEFLSYEGSFTAVGGAANGLTSVDIGVAETADTPVGQSLQRIAGVWTGPLTATKGAINSDDDGGDDGGGLEPTAIYTIQGAGHTSALVGQQVLTTGIVTAVDSNGFYLQDAVGDGDIATSDAIFVFTGSAPTVAVGDGLEVTGTVSEFTPGSVSTRNLSTTQLSGSLSITTLSSGNPLPEVVVLGAGGRVPPSENIDDDAFASFDPATDGIDFFESLEGMRVTAQNLLVVNGTNGFGEIFGVVDGGAGATGLSTRGTLNLSPDDFNPERVQVQFDSGVFDFAFPEVNVGDNLGDVTGVVNYDFGNFQIVATEDFTGQIQAGGLAPEVSALTRGDDQLTVASYNVLNLDPNDGDGDADVANGQFDAIAQQIVNNLNTPDIIALQEVQDNSGSANDGVTAADVTLQTLVDAIAAAGGPTYAFIDNPFIVNNASGGQPGANIRTAYLYDPSRVNLVEGSVATIGGQAPGETFAGARLPLVADFEFNGETVTLVNNHFSSKGGSAPILGTEQPFEALQEDPTVNGSLDERQAQSEAVQGYVSGLLASDPNANVVVLGDLNEFEFVSPVTGLESAGLTNLTNTLDPNERYSYIFQGNSQTLDHILVSDSLAATAEYDAVHINAEFAEALQASDHDPVLARFTIEATNLIEGTPQRDVLTGSDRSDTILASGGPDLITTGGGRDRIVYTSTAQTGATITDFAVGADRLVFTDLLASVGYSGTDPIADGTIQIRNLGNSGRAQLSLELEGVAGRSQFTNFITFQGVDAAALSSAENFVF